MKIKNVETKNLRNVVGKAFIRVAKNHNYYHIFINSFNKLKNNSNSDRNPFGKFKDFDTMMKGIEKFTNNSIENDRRMMMMSGNKDYDKITIMINHMLHFFLENNGVDSRRLGMYGQEIFDIACYSLFGDKYVEDMDSLNNSAPRPTNDMEAYLLSQYMRLNESGKNISWNDFLEKIKSSIDEDAFNESNYRDNFSPDYDIFDENEDEGEDEDDFEGNY